MCRTDEPQTQPCHCLSDECHAPKLSSSYPFSEASGQHKPSLSLVLTSCLNDVSPIVHCLGVPGFSSPVSHSKRAGLCWQKGNPAKLAQGDMGEDTVNSLWTWKLAMCVWSGKPWKPKQGQVHLFLVIQSPVLCLSLWSQLTSSVDT